MGMIIFGIWWAISLCNKICSVLLNITKLVVTSRVGEKGVLSPSADLASILRVGWELGIDMLKRCYPQTLVITATAFIDENVCCYYMVISTNCPTPGQCINLTIC